MTPAEHDKRQAESDAGMEEWDAERPTRLREFAVDLAGSADYADIHAAADEIDRLRGEVATLRRKAEAFDVMERDGLSDRGISYGFPSLLEAVESWVGRWAVAEVRSSSDKT
jgi:hypothetical protein